MIWFYIYQANGACTSGPFLANVKESKPIWRFPWKPIIPITEIIVEGKNDTTRLNAP